MCLLQEDALLSDWMFLYIDLCITTVIAVFSQSYMLSTSQ